MALVFKMSLTAGASPNYGWQTLSTDDTDWWDHTFLPSGGPGGAGAVRIDMIPSDNMDGGGADGINAGWSGAPGWTNPDQGGSRFVCLYLKLSAVDDVIRPDDDPWGGKACIIGTTNEPGNENYRIIGGFHESAPSPFLQGWNVALSTFPSTDDVKFAADTWAAIQYEIQTGTTSSSTDAVFRLYKDNDTSGSPSVTAVTNFDSDPSIWTGIEIFSAMSKVKDTLPTLEITLGGFEVHTTFNASWSAQMNTYDGSGHISRPRSRRMRVRA